MRTAPFRKTSLYVTPKYSAITTHHLHFYNIMPLLSSYYVSKWHVDKRGNCWSCSQCVEAWSSERTQSGIVVTYCHPPVIHIITPTNGWGSPRHTAQQLSPLPTVNGLKESLCLFAYQPLLKTVQYNNSFWPKLLLITKQILFKKFVVLID